MSLDVERAIVAGRVDALLERIRRAPSIAARRHARDAAARALLLADPGSVPPASREEALALRVDPSTVAAAAAPRQPHAVEAPLVAGDDAFARQLLVTYDPVRAGDDPLFGPEAREASRRAVARAAADAHAVHDPAAHRLVAAQPEALRRARIDGPSLGAAAYVSATALFSGRRVRSDVVVTGALRGEVLVDVGGMQGKVAAAAARGARALVVPRSEAEVARGHARRAGARVEIVPAGDTAELRRAALEGEAPRRSPERLIEEARREFARGWEGYRWPTVREVLARIGATLPEGRVDLRVEALTRLGASLRHLGDPVGSLRWLREAEALVASPAGRRGVPDAQISYLWLQSAMTHRQLGRFVDAARDAKRAAEVARRARLLRERIKALGCVGLVALSRRQIARATRAFTESLALSLDFEPDRTARTHAYLMEAHGAAGRGDAVARHHAAATQELERVGADATSRAWVSTSYAGALLALRRPEAAREALEEEWVRTCLEETPLPGLLARRHLGLALCRLGEARRGQEILAVSPVVHGRALEPHLSFLAHVNVLHEARERLRVGRWDPDIAGRSRAALARLPRHGALPALFGDAPARVAAALPGRPDARALDALLGRCARLR